MRTEDHHERATIRTEFEICPNRKVEYLAVEKQIKRAGMDLRTRTIKY